MSAPVFVAYCRASTPLQRMVLQQNSIEAHARRSGAEIIAWYEDVGRASPKARGFERFQPALGQALTHCGQSGATLVVARLDRLTRSTALLAALFEDGVRLCVAEIPQASRLMLHIYAAVAEEQRNQMSRRVRAGIEAARLAGRKRNPHSSRLARALHERAIERARALKPIVEEIRHGRALTISDVAQEMNARGLRMARGASWNHPGVHKLWHPFHRKWHTRRFRGRLGSTGSTVTRDRAVAHAEALRAEVDQYRAEGATTGHNLARRLNEGGYQTVTGRRWHRNMVWRLLRRLAGGPV